MKTSPPGEVASFFKKEIIVSKFGNNINGPGQAFIAPNFMYREHNHYRTYTASIPTVAGQDRYKLNEFELIKDEAIIGIRVRRNSHNSEAPKKDKRGRNIINEEALASAHLTLWNEDNFKFIDEEPLEYYAYDTYEHSIGAYNQIMMNGFSRTQSEICFGDASKIVDGEVIQITFILANLKGCAPVGVRCDRAQ